MKYWLVIEKECIGSNTHMLGTRTKDHNFRTKEEAELLAEYINNGSLVVGFSKEDEEKLAPVLHEIEELRTYIDEQVTTGGTGTIDYGEI